MAGLPEYFSFDLVLLVLQPLLSLSDNRHEF